MMRRPPEATMSIVEEIRQNREKGAKRLESEYKAGLMALARRFCTDESDAEALVNRTFAIVVENVDKYLEQSAFFGWMSRILVNCHAKDVRRKSNELEIPNADMPEDAEDEDACARVFREVDASILRDAIEQLPPEIKRTLLMHYFMDMPIKEVARVLAAPSGTIMWRLHYARQILAAKLGATLKKPAVVALVAIGLFLVASAAAVVGGLRGTEAANHDAAEGQGVAADQAGQAAEGVSPGATGEGEAAAVSGAANISNPSPQGEQTMNKVKKTVAAVLSAALAAIAPSRQAAADGDDYQFIDPATYPAANPSCSASSASAALEIGAYRVLGGAEELEARSRSLGLSSAIALDATEWKGMLIIFN